MRKNRIFNVKTKDGGITLGSRFQFSFIRDVSANNRQCDWWFGADDKLYMREGAYFSGIKPICKV